ncbi:hypothetical protein [Paenarthrobacter nicotinovorans]|uniref:hypothetical protein n=1 Tax=Paenarthrobacter nicotinovorans TaxID=29320 RepID=UPI0012DD2F38|nr:hypothetical protein [Paenarthrobacter nicotinovorans]
MFLIRGINQQPIHRSNHQRGALRSGRGQKGASITMETPTGTSQQDVSIPLKKKSAGASDTGLTFTFDPGDFVYISAQGRGGSNNVICRISVNGKVISQNTATGYGIATCKGKA